jgi:hypothetical protein
MREPWTARRERLDDLLGGQDVPGVGIAPYRDDALARRHTAERGFSLGDLSRLHRRPASQGLVRRATGASDRARAE